jgi:DNA primase
MKKPNFMKTEPFKGLRKVSQLDPDDPIKLLVSKRKIPNPYHAKMFKVPKFFSWVNSFVPEKFDDESLLYDEPRLLIPFLNKKGEMHAFQGRSLDSKSKTKYITIVLDESQPKIFGLDTLDSSKKTYVFEGPVDSMFIPNAIATAGGDLAAAVEVVSKDKMVICYDNEPRSRETIKKIDKAILNGYNVCVWPSNLDFKDVNDMILGGLSSDFVRYIIDQNTFRDLRAKVALNTWKKIDA